MPPGAPLDFLRIWHRVFSQNLEYVIAQLQDASDFRPEVVADDTICKMGRWLAVQDSAVQALPEFSALCAEHSRYHQIAAGMIRAFQAGRHDEARVLAQGDFGEAVHAVELKIDRLVEALGHQQVNAGRFSDAELAPPDSIWSDSLTIGIPDVDRRHHAMAMLIDQLVLHADLDADQADAREFLGKLRDLIGRDADGEQVFLGELRHTSHDCTAHRASHDEILAYLDGLLTGHDSGLTLGDVGERLGDWYIEHLVTFDLDLAILERRRGATASENRTV